LDGTGAQEEGMYELEVVLREVSGMAGREEERTESGIAGAGDIHREGESADLEGSGVETVICPKIWTTWNVRVLFTAVIF